MTMLISTLLLLLVATTVSSYTAIQCYECTDSANCNSGKCSGPACTKFEYLVNGKVQSVTKGCSPIDFTTDGCKPYTLGGLSGSMCSCSKEWCNSAVSVKPWISIVLAITVVIKFIF